MLDRGITLIHKNIIEDMANASTFAWYRNPIDVKHFTHYNIFEPSICKGTVKHFYRLMIFLNFGKFSFSDLQELGTKKYIHNRYT